MEEENYSVALSLFFFENIFSHELFFLHFVFLTFICPNFFIFQSYSRLASPRICFLTNKSDEQIWPIPLSQMRPPHPPISETGFWTQVAFIYAWFWSAAFKSFRYTSGFTNFAMNWIFFSLSFFFRYFNPGNKISVDCWTPLRCPKPFSV
jgi:hypothetical protein